MFHFVWFSKPAQAGNFEDTTTMKVPFVFYGGKQIPIRGMKTKRTGLRAKPHRRNFFLDAQELLKEGGNELSVRLHRFADSCRSR